MKADAADKAVRAQGGGCVTKLQLKAMIVTARRAYDVQAKMGMVDDGVGFDAWRRATLHDVVGAAAPSSFRAVTQRDYAAVMRYFLSLAGEEEVKVRGEGEQWTVSSCASLTKAKGRETEDAAVHLHLHPSPSSTKAADERRRALWSLNLVEGEVAEAFGGRGEARSYADSLFWRIHKTDRYTANARQVWAVIFTLRNRAAKKAKVRGEGEGEEKAKARGEGER